VDRPYWQIPAALQMPEQQSAFEVQRAPDWPQQLQVPPGTGPVNWQREVVPSALRHVSGLQVPP